MPVCRVALDPSDLFNVSVYERNKYRNFVHYVSNETSWPSGLFYPFSWIFAEWRGSDLHSTSAFCKFFMIDFNPMFFP